MRTICLASLLFVSAAAHAEQHSHEHHSPYAGEQTREIKALSQDDMKQIARGAGWGLARAAELNGVPGPMHLLEMQNEIGLSEAQIKTLRQIEEKMREHAIEAGRAFVDAERALDDAFLDNIPTAQELENLVMNIGKARAELRLVHLKAHLETPAILTGEQIERYNQLRGYSANPCDNVPKGHNEEMWRKHNGCAEQ